MMLQEDLYKGFLAICHPDDTLLHLVERYVEQASVQCIREWRKLPHVVSHVHVHLLQAAQQVIIFMSFCDNSSEIRISY